MKKHDAGTTGTRQAQGDKARSFLKRKNFFELRYYHAFLICIDDRFYLGSGQRRI